MLMPIMIFMTKYYPDSIFARRFLSVCYNLKKIFTPAIITGIAFFVISCEENPSTIGTEILPGRDFVSIRSTDTISAFSYTMYDAKARSDNSTYSYFGSIYDPYFGITSAEFVSQIRLGSKWDGKPFTVDSIKLFLQFENVQGNVESDQVLTISEIARQLYIDSAYYSNSPVLLTGYDVASIELPVLKADTINNIELKLPSEFGNYLLRDTAKLFHSNARSDFRSFFKGLYFRITSSTAPLLMKLKLAPHLSTSYSVNFFTLYYHNELDVKMEYYFILDAVNNNARFNRFFHNFEAGEPDKKINHINDGVKDTLSYLQSLSGVYTKVVLPGLEKIKNDPAFSKIAVNKARLTIPVSLDGDILKPSTVASQILLTYKLSDTSYYVPDYSISQSFFDGVLDTINKVYNFNVASFVQKYLEDSGNKIKPELEMLLPSTSTHNAVLKANDSSKPVKFEFTYTKF